MNGADQVRRFVVVQLETELALGVGLGAAGFVHTLAELEQDDFVSGGGLASGSVLDCTGESLSGGKGGDEKDGERNKVARAVLTACWASGGTRRGRSYNRIALYGSK
jgi:hypothetical protein